MKLEFFADAFEGVGLLLLYSGEPSEVERLRDQVRRLAAPDSSVRVDLLAFIEAVDSCELTLLSADSGCGVQTQGGARRFELRLTPSEWERLNDLLEPFCRPRSGAVRFQYLHEHGGIEVIYSTGRQW